MIGLPADGAGVDALDADDGADLLDAPLPGSAVSPRFAPPRAGDAPARRQPIERGPGSDNPVDPPYQPSAHPIDAPIASDLFGDAELEGFDGAIPPEDPAPAQVMEDVGQPYTTPFWVPDPPPIPGIVDRFTPPPAQRTDIGSRRKKPDYLAETPSVSGRYQPTPAPLTNRRPLPRGQEGSAGSQRTEAARPRRSAISMWLVAVSFLFALVGLGSFVGAAVLTLTLPRPPADGERAAEVRPAPTAPAPAPAAPPSAPDPAQEGTPDPAPTTEAATPPPAPPTPAPAAKAKAGQAAPAPAATRPVLVVKSNRRALLYVDDQIIGYAPTDVPIDVGEHRVRAMIPGQPNSEQAKTVKVAPTATKIPIEFTF